MKMNFCSVCKSRHTWDCEDERETGRTRCSDFELDFSALDLDDKKKIEKLIVSYLAAKEVFDE